MFVCANAPGSELKHIALMAWPVLIFISVVGLRVYCNNVQCLSGMKYQKYRCNTNMSKMKHVQEGRVNGNLQDTGTSWWSMYHHSLWSLWLNNCSFRFPSRGLSLFRSARSAETKISSIISWPAAETQSIVGAVSIPPPEPINVKVARRVSDARSVRRKH